ncbi:MAG: hypothetical protein HQK54_17850 [Oligoflexales bacterium]|nr:hypothetical protein [Oligoflexales bacterium]
MQLRKILILFAFYFITPSMIFGNDLPPLGKRRYLIEDTKVFKLSVIKYDIGKPEKTQFLKDPIFSEKTYVTFEDKKEKKKAKIGMDDIKTAKLVFRPYKFSGRLSQPRINFEQDKLSLFRVDEPIKIDYQRKISNTLSELDVDL